MKNPWELRRPVTTCVKLIVGRSSSLFWGFLSQSFVLKPQGIIDDSTMQGKSNTEQNVLKLGRILVMIESGLQYF